MDFVLVLLIQVISIYRYVIIINIILSWFPQVRQSGFGRFISTISEPFLEPFRRIIPSIGMFDFSPIVSIFALEFAIIGIDSIRSFI
ncbi:YggT family protein [Gottfriedia luciferensis]|uniref:YggT family protein n=1 Tax=Gottfriedia luciferensis TaxID=178774 RepID=UPI000B430A34|nr:YggT family protein [Gottfriedia luciferensis]